MTCIIKGNTRCTKCCEAIHIPKRQWVSFRKGKIKIGDSASIGKYWKPISKRVAKIINPYIFTVSRYNKEHTDFLKKAQFFTCTALELGVGCTIRDQEDHPEVCKIFEGGHEYSATCLDDINIIARG